MADFQTSIELKAVTGQLNAKLAAVGTNLKKVDTQVKKTEGAFKKMGTKVGKTFDNLNKKIKEHKAAIAGIGIAMAGIAVKGVADFKKFEDGMAQIGTLGVKDLKKVEEQLDKVRKQFGITGDEATKGYYDVISAGAQEGSEALDRLTAATKLAKAGNTDLAGAIDVVTSGLNIFGDNGETATTITDKLFLAVKFGKTTVEELGQTFGFVAPVVDAAGLSMADYAASMATVTAGGVQTKQATTGIKAVLSNLIKVTPKAAKAAERLGIDFSTAALKSKGLVGVMQEIKEKTGGNVDELGKLFDSIEAINTVAVMTSDTGITSLARNFDAMGDSAGTTADALELVKQTASYNFDKFNQSLSIMSKNIGSALIPALLDMAEAFAPVVDFFAALIAQHPGIVKIAAAMTAFGVSFAFLGGPFTAIVATAGAGFVALMKHFNGFEEGGVAALEKMKLAWSNFWAGFQKNSVYQSVSKTLGKFGDLVNGKLGSLFSLDSSSLSESFTRAFTKAKESVKGMVDYISNVSWKDAFGDVGQWLTDIGDWFFQLYDDVVGHSYYPDLIKGIKEWTDKLHGWLVIPIKEGLAKVSDFFKSLFEDTKSKTKEFVETVRNEVDNLDFEEIKLDIQGAAALATIDNLKSGVSSLRKAVGEVVAAWALQFTKLTTESMKANAELKKLIKTRDFLSKAKTVSVEGIKGGESGALKKASTVGKEVLESRIKTAGAEMDKLIRQMDDKIKGRGFISRFFFGNGTLITWQDKLGGFTQQVGKGFNVLGGQMMKYAKMYEDSIEQSSKKQIAKSKLDSVKFAEKVKRLEEELKGAKRAASKAKLEKVHVPKAFAVESVIKTQLNLQKVEKAYTAAKLAQSEAVIASTAEVTKSTGKLTAILERLGGIFKALGGVMSTVVKISGGVISSLAKVASAIASSKMASWVVEGTKAAGEFTKVTPALKLLGGIARKVLIPVFAVIDAFKGYTEDTNLVENTGKAIEDITGVDKIFSAVAEAIGNFASGFFHLGGTILDWFGADKLAEYFKSVDLAPKIGKVFQAIKTIFTAIVNVFSYIFSGGEGDSEAGVFTKLVTRIGDLLNSLLDTFTGIADGLLSISEGNFLEGIGKISGAILGLLSDVAKAVGGAIADVAVGLSGWATDMMKGVFTSVKDWILSVIGFGGDSVSPDVGRREEDQAILDRGVTGSGHAKRISQKKYDAAQRRLEENKYATGGHVTGPGTGTSDSIPALLSNGEFVINAKATKKNRALLEWINGNSEVKDMEEVFSMADAFGQGGNFDLFDDIEGNLGSIGSKDLAKIFSANKFKDGGIVGGGSAGSNSVSNAKSYQFLQFTGDGSNTDAFDIEATIEKFAGDLDKTSEPVRKVVKMMEDLARLSNNLTEQEVLEHDYATRINRELIQLLPKKKEEALVTKGTTGAVKDLGETAEEVTSIWKNIGQEFTGPIKASLLKGGKDFKESIKTGLHGLFSKMASNYLDQAMKPLEDSITNWVTSISTGPGGSMDFGEMFEGVGDWFSELDLGEMFGGGTGGGLFDGIGSFFGGLDLGGMFGGGTGGGLFDGIGSFFGGLFSDGGMVPQYLATGGSVVDTSHGPKGSDTVPAWLTPGEVVLNAGQQKNVAGAMSANNGGAVYNTYNLEVTGNVDQRAIDQIRNVIQSSPNQVNNASSTGKRNASGIRRR